jgi:hypothetical protein
MKKLKSYMRSACTVRNAHAHKNEPVNHKVHNSPCAFISNAAVLKEKIKKEKKLKKGTEKKKSVKSE